MNQIIQAVERYKIIAILRGIPADKLADTAEALYRGGIRLLEVTYSADGSVSDEETADRIRALVERFDGRMYIGAGTVLTERQVELTKQAGGSFIISPNTDKDVIQATKRCGLISMPGALTPSEVVSAHRYGADFVKLFPVSDMGSSYVKAVKAPLSHIKLLAVGGIDPSNMAAYLQAGACGFGIASSLTPKDRIAQEKWNEIEDIAKTYVAVIEHA